MTPTAYPLKYGRLCRGTIYDYAKAGDTLDVHTHTDTDNHITIITNGILEVIGDNPRKGQRLGPGMPIDWKAGEPHGFRAVTPARMINILINGNPERINGPI